MKQLVYIFFVFFVLKFSAQETGYLIRNYSPKEYDAFNQSWSSAQDSSGIMYFGTSTNIATFDGSRWGKISLKFGLPIRSLLYADNKMYTATVGDFGFIDYGKNKKPFFHSLTDLLKPEQKKFSDVWKIYKWNGFIAFQCSERIFLYNGSSIKTVEPEKSFALSFLIGDHFYIRQREIGFMELQTDLTLKLIKGGELYKDFPIVSMCDDPVNNRFVLGGSRDGIVFLDKSTGKTTFLDKSKNDYFLNAYPLFMSKPDKDTWFLGTRAGLHVLNNDFSVRTLFNKNSGLYDDVVTGICFSKDSNLWVTLNNGISMIEWGSDGFYITEKSGYKGTPEDIIEFNGKNYFSTTHCIYSVDINNVKKHIFNFNKVNTELSEYWDLEKVNGKLFCAASAGLFEIKENKTEKIHTNWARYLLKISDTIPLLFSLEKDFLTIVDVKGTPKIVKRFAFKGEELMHGYANFENGKYTIWFTSAAGILKKLVLSAAFELISERKYTIAADTVTGSKFVNFNDGELSITHGTEIFYYHPEKDLDSTSQCFETNRRSHFKNPASITFSNNFEGRSYTGSEGSRQFFPVKTKNGTYKLVTFNLKQDAVRELQAYFTDDSLNVWFTGPEFIVLLKRTREIPFAYSFPVILTQVQAGRDSSLVWYGMPIENSFKYKDNSFSFEYSAPFFTEPEQTKYRCRLVGGDDSTWTNWSQIKHKEYTNLHEGNYSFMVQAKNVFYDQSSVTTYSFSVSPPWYRTTLAYLLYFVVFCLVVYLIVRMSNYKLKQSKIKLEKLVSERTHELEEKKKEITDSIRYALRIQLSILPPEKFVKRLLPDSFIFYKPKDIVSGDFYWVEETPDKVLFAAVDCTGHGVPGAMMSVIGLKLLNSAVLDKNLSVPSDILQHLDVGVSHTLRQSEATNSVRDGMDLALCAWNQVTNVLEYAGVSNTLWLVRKNIATTYIPKNKKEVFYGNDLLEIKADKMEIGSNENNVPDIYTNNTFQLQPGDCIYIYSDGYADQFGGERGKKFKYTKLKDLLIENAHLSVAKQEKALATVFDEWKGSNEQVDDVLIMGIKVR
ncbi:MAG: SpoIIE family protein phosphatase [Bacteroidia bacterium]|nr:SpoIIE family protein phosphatase [Bacteroidia bacterium]